MRYYLGCSGWSYDGWKGPFYPQDLDNRYWLSYYSQIFDFVEIDSTFYRIPSSFMVNNWSKRTPDNFKFAVKLPKVITHDKRLKDVAKDIERDFMMRWNHYMIRYLYFYCNFRHHCKLQKDWI